MAFHKIKELDIWFTPAGKPRSFREDTGASTVSYGIKKMKKLFSEGCQEIVMYVRYGEDDPRNFQMNFDDKGKLRRHNGC